MYLTCTSFEVNEVHILKVRYKVRYMKPVSYCHLSEVIFFKILVKRGNHFLKEQLLECSEPVGPHAARPRMMSQPDAFDSSIGFFFCVVDR